MLRLLLLTTFLTGSLAAFSQQYHLYEHAFADDIFLKLCGEQGVRQLKIEETSPDTSSKASFLFNRSGNLTSYHTEENGVEQVQQVMEYTAGGLLSGELQYFQGVITKTLKHYYNKSGTLRESFHYGARKAMLLRDVYGYDKQGQPEKIEHYMPEGFLSGRTTFTYKAGLLKEERVYTRATELQYTLYYRYDQQGRLTSKYNDRTGLTINYSYSDDRALPDTLAMVDETGETVLQKTFTYNTTGLPVQVAIGHGAESAATIKRFNYFFYQ